MDESDNIEHKKRIRLRYNEPEYVKTYDRRYDAIQLAKYDTILPYLNINHSGWILDVGVGTGLLLKKFINQWALVVGIDLSLSMLKTAKKRIQNNTKVELILADADHLPFKEDIFPTVTTFTLLQNMPNPLNTIRELLRVSNGVVAITVLKKKIDEISLREILQKSGKRFSVIESESEDILAVCYIV